MIGNKTLGLGILSTILLVPQSVYADISGMVFRDFNANGVKDTATSADPRTDTGVAGVTITAYDTAGTSFAAVSDSTGGYEIDASTGIGPFRVEFTNLPADYYPTSNSSGAGASGTTVQFASDGNTGNVNLGINNPEDYSQANPHVVIPLYKPGNSGTSGLQKFSYDAPKTGDGSGIPESLSTGSGVETPVSLATPAEIGTVWGVAYQQSQNRLFTTAFLRRHAAMADGVGYVYVIDPATGLEGKFNLEGVTPSNTSTPIEVGAVTRTNTGLTTDDNNVSGQLNRDLDAFAKVGKMSFGDADIDGTGNTLWVVNLFEKTLLAVDVHNTTATLNNATATALTPLVREYSIPAMTNAPTCSNGELRPWGLGFYRSQGYLGVVCDASGAEATLADLDAYVLRFDPSNPSAGFASTPALTFGLDYNRELASVFSREAYFGKWSTWTDSWNTISTLSSAYLDATTPPNPVKPQVNHHMPLVSDIEFTDDGSMVVALLDRNGYMLGRQNLAPYTGSPAAPRNALIEHVSSGDIIHACHLNGAFVLEGTGGCTVKDDGAGTTTQGNYSTPLPTSVTNDGPSNTGEFYYNDAYFLGTGHNEIGLGALAVQHGRNEIVATVYDPLGYNDPAVTVNTYGLNVNGLHYYNSTQGNFTAGYLMLKNDQSVSSAVNLSTDNWTFGKANALGDIELLANPAPIEIGNRVWRDIDADGIQDADEPGIDDVDVVLSCGTDTTMVKTVNGGKYLFSSASSAPFLVSGKTCILKITATGQAALDGLNPTITNADGMIDNHYQTDLRDSDANAAGEITFTIGNMGENNHTLDFGYKSDATTPPFTPPLGPTAVSCVADTRLATSVQVNGDSQAAGSTGANVNGLITFDYAATGELAAPFSKATAGQVGSVWGLAYDNVRKKLYASAFLKRHASFGPNGIGAIYQMDGISTTPTPSLLIDLAANGVDVGTSSRVVFSGAVDDPNELPADASQSSWDRDAFAQIGKISLGDIDISADGNTLWAVNLKQRELVEINLISTTVTAKHAIPDPGCSNGDYRPWAVKVHDSNVWVGTICSAETSQQVSDLQAYVQAFDGSAFTTATSFALNYPKGSVGNGSGDEKWQPWTSTYQTLAAGDFAIYPQPILSDIEFDMDGSMILGFMDRMGHQVGGVNYTPNYPDDDTMIQGQTGGDIIRVCNNNGKYELENNATCTSGSTAGKDKGQGHGNGEYYWGDMWDFNPWNADGGFHQETSFGGLAFKAGSGEIALTSMNPLKPHANAGGLIWLDNATGGRSANEGVQVYQGNSHYFGKAAGMGDVEIFCAEAPVSVDLQLEKSVSPTTAKRGDTVVYTLTVTNESNSAATGVEVTEQLPVGVQYVSDDSPGAYVTATGIWTVGELAAKASKTITISVLVK